jgi:hypothetical protein
MIDWRETGGGALIGGPFTIRREQGGQFLLLRGSMTVGTFDTVQDAQQRAASDLAEDALPF